MVLSKFKYIIINDFDGRIFGTNNDLIKDELEKLYADNTIIDIVSGQYYCGNGEWKVFDYFLLGLIWGMTGKVVEIDESGRIK